MLKKIRLDKTLLLIVLAGLAMRLAGTTHGFPFIFHPDEPAVVRSATGIRFDSNPAHFDWPHMHFYLNFAIYWVFIKFRGLLQLLGLQELLSGEFPLLWRDPLVFYFLSRVFNVFLGALTAIPVYLASKELFNKKVGYLAAATLLLIPHHLLTSSFALIDIPTAFWVAWAFYFSVKIFKESMLKNYLWAGLFVGFAASTKYNGGLMALMVPIAHFLRTWQSSTEKLLDFKGFKLLVLSGVLAAFGFVLGTPYALFDYDTFSRTDGPDGAYWQFTNVGKVDFPQQVTQFLDNLTFDAFFNYGYTIIILYLAAVLYGIFVKRERRLWLILLPSLFLFFYISGFEKTRAHYYTSVYPLVATAVGYMVWLLLQRIPGKLKVLVLALVFALPLYFSFFNLSTLARPDTRVELYNWLLTNFAETDHVYYTSKSLAPVMEKFDDFAVDRLKEDTLLNDAGYIVLGLNDEELADFNSGLDPDAQAVQNLTRVLEIDSAGRRGNHIMVYEYGKN